MPNIYQIRRRRIIQQRRITRLPHRRHHDMVCRSARWYFASFPNLQKSFLIRSYPGTVNYIHLFPMFCVSIAFINKGKPLIGVINAPFINQFFSSCSGRGAFLNETTQLPLFRNPVPPMPANAPSGCVFSCEWGKDRRDIPDGNLHRKIESFVNMAAELGGRNGRGGMVHGVRSLGSATLDLAYIAMGSFDIWWEGGCWEWYATD